MAPRAESRGRLARLTLAAAALRVLLTIVAVPARTGLGDGDDRPEPRGVLLGRLFTAFLLLFVLYIRSPPGSTGRNGRRSSRRS